MNTTKANLTRIADELLELSESLPDTADAEARLIRRAAYILEDVKTSQAVGELIQAAGHKYGVVGPVGYSVLRQKGNSHRNKLGGLV